MFRSDGKVVQPAEALYKKAVLVERSRFRPPTRLTMSLLDRAYMTFCKDSDVDADKVIVLSEMTLHNLTEGEDIDVQDYLHRAEILCALGKHVLISSYGEFYRLAQYLSGYTRLPIGIALGVPTLAQIFNEKYYDHLEGGILEAFGRLFKNDLRLYVCPMLEPDSGELVTVNDLEVQDNLRHLYLHLLGNRFIREIDGIDRDELAIFSHNVLEKIRRGEHDWESLVPETVVRIIRSKHLFGCRG
jgi:hypothetical protein